jgi:predicted NACHT family NTPase
VLKSIEVQHGLLVEQARGIYSFYPLRFQEYFTAKQLVSSLKPEVLDQLVNHITSKRWHEVFLLTVAMLPKADRLLLLMKHQIDAIAAADKQLQKFLNWVNQKSNSVQIPYKPVAVRAFYLTLDLDRSRAINFTGVLGLARNLDRTLDLDSDLDLDLNLDLDLHLALDLNLDRAQALHLPLERALDRATNLELHQKLQQLQQQLPQPTKIDEQWLKANSQVWTEQLRAVMIQYRNIGHDWKFSKQQKELLKQYYNANKLLVDCLNSGCNVTPAVREEIEETLFLPIAEIEKRGNCQDR